MTFALTHTKSGTLLTVRVKPRAKTNSITGVRDEKLLISVNAAPTDGAANAAVLAVLAKVLRVAPSSLSVARGHKSREKSVCISSLTLEEILSRLTVAIPSD